MPKQIVAHMAGTILSIGVEPGATVEIGDSVAVLESMKMEMVITADVAGTVSETNAKPGDVVDEGAPILTIV